ncbi:MAG: AAA family ATPase, partial [Rhizobacter sp.]|nr:AAA family ATPase [Rhizobacter sp.]
MQLCRACGAENTTSARFCSQCAHPLAAAPAGASAPAGAERKQVSVLFCDLTGFTAISERLDPEETRQIMARIFGLAAEIVGRYDGRIEKFIGDAIMALFGVPQAHEDDPVRAVRAALKLHEAVARLAPELAARTGAAVAMHSGVNTGVVVTGELHFDHGTAGPLGDTINLAARLMNAAPSGQIWIGPQTRRLVGHLFELEDLGAQTFKGKAQPVEAARVLRARSSAEPASRHRGSFVGRQAELGALLGAVEKVRDGTPQVYALRGDAGTGKTRLVAELRERVGNDVRWLEGRAYPYAQDTPYAPLIDLFSRMLGIEETDPPAAVRAALGQCVSELLGEAPEALPLLLHLFHLEQEGGLVIEREAFREQLEAALRRMIGALARRAPTVICVQDLHWADPSTTALLQRLAADLLEPVLMLLNYRPGAAVVPGVTELTLGELSPRQTGELLHSLLQGEPPAELARFVVERCDGNPFFIEEIVNALVETEVLRRTDRGWQLARSPGEAGLPSTIRGVLAARIDRLDEARRRVLRQAAVVGREFLFSIVERVTDADMDLPGSLVQLESADLIRTRRLDPELEYIFKHALTQDVAYEGLLKTERQMLHARTAQAIETVLAARIPEFVETLALHWLRAGVADKAVHYLTGAGLKCVERFALPEATRHFRQAYKLLAQTQRTPEQRHALAELLCAWSQVHYYEGTIDEWRSLLEKHL